MIGQHGKRAETTAGPKREPSQVVGYSQPAVSLRMNHLMLVPRITTCSGFGLS